MVIRFGEASLAKKASFKYGREVALLNPPTAEERPAEASPSGRLAGTSPSLDDRFLGGIGFPTMDWWLYVLVSLKMDKWLRQWITTARCGGRCSWVFFNLF